MNIAFIPARSGSKSVKDKNIKMLSGKPLIAYSIEQCFKSRLFKNVYVSTDSKKYARISQRFGPVKIILRPKKISKDKINDIIAATKTLKVVALFQNRATKNITRMPGVKNPVKF